MLRSTTGRRNEAQNPMAAYQNGNEAHGPIDLRYTKVFDDVMSHPGDELDKKFNSLLKNESQMMFAVGFGYNILASNPDFFEKNPMNSRICGALLVIGLLCIFLAAMLNKGRMFVFLVSTSTTILNCLLFMGCFHAVWSESATLAFGIFGGAISATICFIAWFLSETRRN